MTKNVTFQLGPATNLSARQLTITRMPDAANANYGAQIDTDVGAVTTTTQILPDNILWQATLVDTHSDGSTSETDVLNFHTGSLQFPGPSSGDRLSIQSMEDLSSSSSSSSASSSSSGSSSSSSSGSSSASSSSSSFSVSFSSSSSISSSSSSST